jgi:hypothetical protein
MKRLEQDPRIVNGPGLFASVLDWARRVTVAINVNVDEYIAAWLGFTVARTGTNGTIATIATINGADGDAVLVLNKAGAAQNAGINAYKSGVLRWQMLMGNSSAESGGNAGSDFSITRFSDAGAGLATAFSILRSNGQVNVAGTFIGAAGVQANGNGPGFTSNNYFADGPNYATALLVSNPNWESVNWQAYHATGVWAGCRWIIGTTTPAVFEMRNNGTGYSVGGWVATSDGSVKRNRAAVTGLQQRAHLAPAYAYDRTDMRELDGSMCRRIGIIADDFEGVEPLVVFRDKPTPDNPDPLRAVDYNGVAALAWQLGIDNFETIKTLRAQIIQLRNEIEILKGN